METRASAKFPPKRAGGRGLAGGEDRRDGMIMRAGEYAGLHRVQSSSATFSAVTLADCGFCPVTSRPSATTFGVNGSKAFS